MDKRCGILIVSVTLFVLGFVGTASATTWSVDGSGGADFTRIQEAINNASADDMIIVHSGVYYENVYVNESVTLKGIGYPVVDANGSGSAITLNADGITLVGFTATNSSSLFDAGIKVIFSNNTITANNVSNNSGAGICLYDSSSSNCITGNNVRNNDDDGIYLKSSSNNNTITGNTLSNNNYNGISLYDSGNNCITGNNVRNNNYGSINLYDSSNNSITGNNFCNNKYGISISHSSNNGITGNNFCNNNWNGIRLSSSNNNTLTANNVSNNNWNGIHLSSSNNNTLTANNVSNNSGAGICLYDSSNNNNIYLNNFMGNRDNVDSSASINIWNSILETYTYNGTTYKSYLGNYRDDYEGRDADRDGIGDTPFMYSIDSDSVESDLYPLMKPFENYYITTSAYT